MDRIAAATLALALALAGCLKAGGVDCSGVDEMGRPTNWTCPVDKACALKPNYCGEPEQVAKCAGLREWTGCSFSETGAGSCRGRVCEPCDTGRAGCSYEHWYQVQLPGGPDLNSVWAADVDLAFAVGDAGEVLRYDGIAWRHVVELDQLVAGAKLLSVTGVRDPLEVFVLADNGKAFRLNAAGTWVDASPGSTYPLVAVWESSAGTVLGVGLLGESWRFDGSWLPVTQWMIGKPNFAGLAGTSASSAVAVGVSNTDGVLWSFDGTTWSPSLTIPNLALTAVWVGGNAGVAVGYAGASPTIAQLSTSWLKESMPGVTAGDLFAVWGSARDDVFAAGSGGVIIHYDGAQWMRMSTPGALKVTALSGTSPTDVFAVTAGGAIWHYSGVP